MPMISPSIRGSASGFLQLAEAIFQPEQLLLYGIARTQGPNGPQRELRLSLQHGFRELPPELKAIPAGLGKIGWVAVHQLDMVDRRRHEVPTPVGDGDVRPYVEPVDRPRGSELLRGRHPELVTLLLARAADRPAHTPVVETIEEVLTLGLGEELRVADTVDP